MKVCETFYTNLISKSGHSNEKKVESKFDFHSGHSSIIKNSTQILFISVQFSITRYWKELFVDFLKLNSVLSSYSNGSKYQISKYF